MSVELNKCYRTSEDVIAREIEGDLVIVPLKSGIGDLDSEMYALNATGIAVWNLLDGTSPLEAIIRRLAKEYDASQDEIKSDILELMDSLLKKGLVAES